MRQVDTNRTDLAEQICDRLHQKADDLRAKWNDTGPIATRHFVLDDLLPAETCQAIHAAFPSEGEGFFERDTFRERKKTSASLAPYAPILSDIIYAFQQPSVLQAIYEITGIEGLEADPSLYAGGLSMMFEGDFLNPHIDNSHDAVRKAYRRLNLLYYVSPDWVPEMGGSFELWDERRQVANRIPSLFNRLVVMETNRLSWHSVSRVNASKPRCCVSNYYFSQTSPDEEDYFHVTSFDGRPEEPLRRMLSKLDNAGRNSFSRLTKWGRGRDLINKDKGKTPPP